MAIYQGAIKVASNIISGDTLPIGSMIPFGSLTIPEGWLRCDGSAVSRTTYSQLFSVIGTSYGVGDGSTTFNLPNKKGKSSVGYDSTQTEFNTIGKTGGAKTHTLTVDEMPLHTHSIDTKYLFSGTSGTAYTFYTLDSGIKYPTGSTGSGQAHNNLQPYETDVWIIKVRQSSGVVATVVDNLTSTSSINALSANQGKVLNDNKQSIDGWILSSGTYASATTITVTSGAANVYSKGDRLRLKQGGNYKYFNIIGVTDTVLNITGGSDYTLTNTTITDMYYSHETSPVGFPDWFNYSSTILGFTEDVTTSQPKFKILGKSCFVFIETIIGTSNNGAISFTLPVTALLAASVHSFCAVRDNGTNQTIPGHVYCDNNSNTMVIYKTFFQGTFTTSGSKAAWLPIISYEF